MSENPVVAAFSARRVTHDRGLLNWLDPLFERQILDMCLMKHHGKTRAAEDVWEAITASATRSGLNLDEPQEKATIRYDV